MKFVYLILVLVIRGGRGSVAFANVIAHILERELRIK